MARLTGDLRGRWHDDRCGLPDDVDEGNGLTQAARSRIATRASARSAIDSHSHSRSWRAAATRSCRSIRRTAIRRAIGITIVAIGITIVTIGIAVGTHSRRLSDLRDGSGDAGGGNVG